MRLRTPVSCSLLLLFAAALLAGCNSCGRGAAPRRTAEPRKSEATRTEDECVLDTECDDEEPCTAEACDDGLCVSSPVAEGTSCDDGDVCNGVARCSAKGVCVPGPPPTLDDGDACTKDTCDPTRGVSHEPVPVDDSDACTLDSCDASTGAITHGEVDIDDGDDCTFDSCDPRSGVQHRRADPTYTCAASCGPGYHASSRSPSAECGSRDALRSVCLPDCGPSFYTCDAQCPQGYLKKSESLAAQCGPAPATLAFCAKH